MLRFRLQFAALVMFALFCAAQDDSPDAADEFRISLSVERVPLYVTVRDAAGNLVDGLTEKHFNILQDDRPQAIREFHREDVPIAVGLILDNSGSMQFKSADVLAAAKAFISSRAEQDEFFVVHFNSSVRFGLPFGTLFSRNPLELNNAIDSFFASGETSLYDAAYTALEHVEKSKFPKKVLILISDGGDTSSKHSAGDVVDLADRSGVLFYGVGVYDSKTQFRSPAKLRGLAHRTGGEAYFPKTTTEVVKICQQIAQDLRRQYTLVYSPTNPPGDKKYHRIRVLANGPDRMSLRVYARAGYYANHAGAKK